MELEPMQPKKAVMLSGKRSEPAYSVQIQIVQHPNDYEIRRNYAVHRPPYDSRGEVACLTTFGSRCPICDAVKLDGEPVAKWSFAAKKLVMFYGIIRSDQLVKDQVIVQKDELVLWTMIGNDFKFIDQVISQRRLTGHRFNSYTFDLTINPGANFAKREQRCSFNFTGETSIDPASIFNDETPPLGQLYYSVKHPTENELERVVKAYCQIPLKIERAGVQP